MSEFGHISWHSSFKAEYITALDFLLFETLFRSSNVIRSLMQSFATSIFPANRGLSQREKEQRRRETVFLLIFVAL